MGPGEEAGRRGCIKLVLLPFAHTACLPCPLPPSQHALDVSYLGIFQFTVAVFDGEGSFSNKGDGGFINWCFNGNYQRDGSYVSWGPAA